MHDDVPVFVMMVRWYIFSVNFKPQRSMVALDIGAHSVVFGTGIISDYWH